jgi:hypothetical protein
VRAFTALVAQRHDGPVTTAQAVLPAPDH